MSESHLSRELDESRWTLRREGRLVSVLDYRDDGRTIAMTRVYTVPEFRGHGYAAQIVAGAVAEIEAAGDREVSPVCWYAAQWFDEHPDHRGILRQRSTP